MDGLFAVAIVWGSLAIGLFALASTAWYQQFGDRRLAAEVSAALNSQANDRINIPTASRIPLAG